MDDKNYIDFKPYERMQQSVISARKSRLGSSLGFIGSLFGVVVCVLLVFSILHNGDTLTFESFLDFLASQSQNFDYAKLIDYGIVGDWGIFNFLKDLLNTFISILNVAWYVCQLAYKILQFLVGLLQFMLG